MATSLHKDLVAAERHAIHHYEYANAAARTGATGFVAGDVGRVAKQTDNDTYWILIATTPTWKEITNTGLVASDEKVKVTSNDTTTGFLKDKMIATEGVQVTELNDGGDEDLQAKLDINGLTADATPDGAADYIATYDASAGAHKKVLIDNLPTGGGSGGAKREVIACNDLDNAHIRSPHSTYTCVTRFTFGGTTAVGTPAAVKGVGFHTDGGGTAQFRIYDLTNAQQIAESAAFSNTDPQIFSFGALSNLSTGEAIWEIQGKASTKNAFISSVEIHW